MQKSKLRKIKAKEQQSLRIAVRLTKEEVEDPKIITIKKNKNKKDPKEIKINKHQTLDRIKMKENSTDMNLK